MENRNDSRNVSDFYRPVGNSGSAMNTNTECNGLTHTIQRGDTLYTLSKRYNVPLSLIMRANRDVDIYNLTIGTTLCIPNVRATAPEKYAEMPRTNMTVPERTVTQPRSTTTPTSKKMMNQFVEKVKEEKVCPTCSEQKPCPEAAPCPTCPEQKPCPEAAPCPTCPEQKPCPEPTPCPACPEQKPCPEPTPCPACPEQKPCPEAAPCPTCPEQQPCPEAAPCPSCPEQQPCPACPEQAVNVTMEKNYKFVLPVQKTMPCNVCPKKESKCMEKEKACPYQERTCAKKEFYQKESCNSRYNLGRSYYYKKDSAKTRRYDCGCDKADMYFGDECNTNDDPRYQKDSLYRYGGECNKSEHKDYDTSTGTVPYTKVMAHIVTDRETLEDILNMFGMTLDEILSYNKTREIHLCPGKAIMVKKNQ